MPQRSASVRQNMPKRAENPQGKAVETRIVELDSPYADLARKLVEIEATAARRWDSNVTNHSSFQKMNRATIESVTETRCENLRATLKAIERERLATQIELAIILQD